jgi:hypothetical protein
MTGQFTFSGDIVWHPKVYYGVRLNGFTVTDFYYSQRLE